ncbi:MAG: hypothetical protein E5X53_26125 [Mesorhizobium sp.]|uniref:hypothetical protein n=1 Tax=Mesorhizobium sp. TaxID=1871066 RepID=UPI00120368C4|nr:hypothetical protein [Mesorhizobium sp.]TIR49111.1 MAG: hypothetical protein E5X53_26125 [Mesorhizobium sp.]
MLYEYAVEPAAIAADWQTCRYLAEKFGFDRGRLLSLFPKAWLRLAIDSANDLPEMQKKRVIEKLKKLKDESSIRSGRAYEPALGDWLANAIAQNGIDSFRAIIASANPSSQPNILTPDQVEEQNPLIRAPSDAAIARDAPALATAMKLLLRSAKTVLFVDAYYDPYDARYQATLRACLKEIRESNPGTVCQIHHLDGKGPAADAIERDAKAKFAKVIPDGMAVSIFRWREWRGGEDFHARFVLTDKGGIGIDAGLSSEGKHQTTIIHLMSCALAGLRVKALARDATVYELVEPILWIDADGAVSHL